MAETLSRRVTIAGSRFNLRRDRVERAMRGVLAEPLNSHFVVVNRRRYPPKQVISQITGIDRADFTTHQARRILMGLGFPVGRASRLPRRTAGSPQIDPRDELVETLRSLVGQWVAVRDDEVLVSAGTPQEVVSWLSRHRQRADSMFRVPEDELAATGIAPS
jgi:hypothetical protein